MRCACLAHEKTEKEEVIAQQMLGRYAICSLKGRRKIILKYIYSLYSKSAIQIEFFKLRFYHIRRIFLIIHLPVVLLWAKKGDIYLFIYLFIYVFNPHPRTCLLILERERGRVRERNTNVREKHQLPPICTLTRDQTDNLGMCSEQETNTLCFGLQNDAPTN